MKHQLQPYKLLWDIVVSSNSLKTLLRGTKNVFLLCSTSLFDFLETAS